MRTWVAELAIGRHLMPLPKLRRKYLRNLAVDLWANGWRRLQRAEYEDAILRAYRVLELIGQFRLLDYGLDSGRLPPNDPAVIAVEAKLESENSAGLASRDGYLLASRFQVTQLLKVLGDPLRKELARLGVQAEIRGRNVSVLIHGFSAFAVRGDETSLRNVYQQLRDLLLDDGRLANRADEVVARLRIVDSFDFSRS